ncbi:hypothetical protein [Qipengyuania nanhaisediminis]|uniref:hypothetical protein n=1 Tax=Qipengyuania nanhaisediminis TaxID=604088 RepID=UPI0011604123|nr:hypothetical protein [Qipengyuania nanhaisediminis]
MEKNKPVQVQDPAAADGGEEMRDAVTSDRGRNADRRDARSRARKLRRLLAELEIEPELAEQIVSDLSSLLPPQHRMSRDKDVAARLKALLERDAKAPHALLMRQSGAEIDVSSEGAIRSTEKLSELVQEGDERLLQSYVANERLRAVLACQIAEHDAARNVLVAELARRYTVNEQWRYKLPKFMMPLVAVMLKAGVRRDDLRLGNTLLGAVIDLVAQGYQAEGIAKIDLIQAAQNAEQLFESFEAEEVHGQQSGAVYSGKAEHFSVAEQRLSPVNFERRKASRSDPENAEKERAFRATTLLTQAAGGLDEFGRPVFQSLEDFYEGVKYLKEQNALEH